MTIGNATIGALCLIALGGIIGGCGGKTFDLEKGKIGLICGIVVAIFWIIGVILHNASRAPTHRQR